MFAKLTLVLTFCLFGTSLCIPVATEDNVKETGKPFRYNENEQRQLDTAVTALLGGLLPQIQSTLSNAIQGAATNLLSNFSIWDLLRQNGQIPNEYLEDSPEFDSYVVNLPNVGSFVMLAANKPNDYENSNKKPIVFNKPIGLEQTNSGYFKPSLTVPYKPIVDSDDIEFDKPEYVQEYKPIKHPHSVGTDDIEFHKPEFVHEYKPIKKPYHHHIGSNVALGAHGDKHDALKNLFDKKKQSFAILQHKFHEQKEKIIAETLNHINKLQSQLLGQFNDDYHTTSHHYHEYEAPEIINKPIKKPSTHYIGYKSTNVQQESDFE